MTSEDCPAVPGMSSAQEQCAIGDEMTGTNYCAAVCLVADADAACPEGMGCQDLMDADNPGLGICTWPEG